MKAVLPLNQMTQLEKIQVMEELWHDLSQSGDSYDSPAWHEDVLKERDKLISEGTEKFIPWEEAKRILREKHT